ncbi:MAG: cytochrome P450, partial [Pseudomonadota bacterium]
DVRLKDGSWIPFGYGPKICIGNTMTMYSMLIFLALIGQRLRFGLVDDDPVLPQRHAATAGPSRHFRFEVERRTRGIHHA